MKRDSMDNTDRQMNETLHLLTCNMLVGHHLPQVPEERTQHSTNTSKFLVLHFTYS